MSAEGTSCDDGDPDNVADKCSNGLCAGRDGTPPVITLNGDAEVFIDQDSVYVDDGATATDNVDGPVTVTTAGDDLVDTSSLGGTSFTITYDAVDTAGNAAPTGIRIVTITVDCTDSANENAVCQSSSTCVNGVCFFGKNKIIRCPKKL